MYIFHFSKDASELCAPNVCMLIFFRFDTLCMEAQIDVDKSGDMCLQGASLCVVK